MISTLIIGGKQDGRKIYVLRTRANSVTLDREEYLLLNFKDKGKSETHFFYMRAGMVPADAVKIYRERIKQE